MNMIQRHQPTTIRVIEPAQQPSQVIQYHVHIDNPSWLVVLSQLPASHVYALSVAGGAVGAIAMCGLVVAAAVISQAIAMIAVAGVAVVVGLVTIAVMTGGKQ